LLLVLAPVLIWLLQGSPTIAAARLKPQWSKLSPLAGLGRMFGPRALVEFGKTLLKASAVGLIALMVIWPRMAGLDQLIGADPSAIGRLAGALIRELLKVMAMAVAALALFDFLYQRQAFLRRMRMSLQDIRDEMKQSDGDPAIKARIRAIRMARARQRMMAAVPKATVVITNPTHYAVALKYEHGVTAAPVVVAKGVDAVAIRIRERAKASDVAIVEAPPLARALHAAVKLDQPIPVEHYTAVAEIIGQIMRLARASAQAQS
jgi:flagellar biosynthetic protein FlhB